MGGKHFKIHTATSFNGLICLVLSVGCILAACRPEPGPSMSIQGFAMATTYSVVVPGIQPDSQTARKLQTEIRAGIARIESGMSLFEPGSDISRFNASPTTDWFPVSNDTADAVNISLEISRETGGAFDITVGKAVQVWGFGTDAQANPPKTAGTDPAWTIPIGYRNLQVRISPPSIRKSLPDLQLDLSGIAKGYAVDRVARIIESFKLRRYRVEIGGELRTSGLNEAGSPWRIGIAAPEESSLEPVLQLTDAAAATSGDYTNYRVSGGGSLSHFIDPETGIPTERKGLSVTVVGRVCARMDAIATALAVLGPEKGYTLATDKGWKVYYMFREGDGWKDRATAGMEPLFSPDSLIGTQPAR